MKDRVFGTTGASKLFQAGYIGDYIGKYYRVVNGDTRSLDYAHIIYIYVKCIQDVMNTLWWICVLYVQLYELFNGHGSQEASSLLFDLLIR